MATTIPEARFWAPDLRLKTSQKQKTRKGDSSRGRYR